MKEITAVLTSRSVRALNSTLSRDICWHTYEDGLVLIVESGLIQAEIADIVYGQPQSEKLTFCFVYVNIFKRAHGPYVNISKHFADHLPTPNCKRNLWRLPYLLCFDTVHIAYCFSTFLFFKLESSNLCRLQNVLCRLTINCTQITKFR